MPATSIEYLDASPDGLGRRAFILRWIEADGGYRPGHAADKGGTVRGQVFRAVPPAGVPEYAPPATVKAQRRKKVAA